MMLHDEKGEENQIISIEQIVEKLGKIQEDIREIVLHGSTTTCLFIKAIQTGI